MYQIKMIGKFYAVLLKSKMEYRLNFFMEIFINLFTYVVTYLGIWILLAKFGQINGWNYYEVMLLYNLNLTTYGIACLFFYIPMRALENMVQSGDFDSILVRPLNPFIHLLLKQNYLGFLSHIILGVVVFCICFANLHMNWTVHTMVTFVLMVTGGSLIQASVIIITGSLSLKFTKSIAVMDTLIYNVRSFIEYPIRIYNKAIQLFLTFFIPYAFVNFYPAEFLLGKNEDMVPSFAMKFAPICIGGVLFLFSYLLFMKLLDQYSSTGH